MAAAVARRVAGRLASRHSGCALCRLSPPRDRLAASLPAASVVFSRLRSLAGGVQRVGEMKEEEERSSGWGMGSHRNRTQKIYIL